MSYAISDPCHETVEFTPKGPFAFPNEHSHLLVCEPSLDDGEKHLTALVDSLVSRSTNNARDYPLSLPSVTASREIFIGADVSGHFVSSGTVTGPIRGLANPATDHCVGRRSVWGADGTRC